MAGRCLLLASLLLGVWACGYARHISDVKAMKALEGTEAEDALELNRVKRDDPEEEEGLLQDKASHVMARYAQGGEEEEAGEADGGDNAGSAENKQGPKDTLSNILKTLSEERGSEESATEEDKEESYAAETASQDKEGFTGSQDKSDQSKSSSQESDEEEDFALDFPKPQDRIHPWLDLSWPYYPDGPYSSEESEELYPDPVDIPRELFYNSQYASPYRRRRRSLAPAQHLTETDMTSQDHTRRRRELYLTSEERDELADLLSGPADFGYPDDEGYFKGDEGLSERDLADEGYFKGDEGLSERDLADLADFEAEEEERNLEPYGFERPYEVDDLDEDEEEEEQEEGMEDESEMAKLEMLDFLIKQRLEKAAGYNKDVEPGESSEEDSEEYFPPAAYEKRFYDSRPSLPAVPAFKRMRSMEKEYDSKPAATYDDLAELAEALAERKGITLEEYLRNYEGYRKKRSSSAASQEKLTMK